MEEQVQASAPEKKSHKKSIIIILSVIIFLVLVFVGGFFILNYLSKDMPNEAEKVSEEDMAELTGEPTRTPSSEVKYSCEENKSIEVAYFNEGDSPSAKLVTSDGLSITLYQVESASGAKYTNSDESMIFWSTGNEAYAEVNGEKTFTDCVENS